MKIIHANQIENSFFEARSFENDVYTTVASIIERVKKEGDNALHDLSTQFDRSNPTDFKLAPDVLAHCEALLKSKKPKLYDALCHSRDLALAFAQKQRECFTDFETELSNGLITGQKIIAVDRAGLYVPSGQFPLLSTVIMCACPAIVAQCSKIILCTPPRLHPNDIAFMQANPGTSADKLALKPWADEGILATASLCGIKHVFALGGAQAIAAMAYGTKTIPRCDLIAGPGNKYVAEAKKQVYGTVGIDMIAGPTEVFIIADNDAQPDWLAADLLAQAEHDVDAQAVLATTSHELAQAVSAEVEKQLSVLATAKIAQKSIKQHGMIIITESFEQAVDIANRKAPEHLELAFQPGKLRDKLEKSLHNYGSLFIGHEAAEVLGDYSAGLNHTLPTSGSSRFTGGLSVGHFLKTLTTLRTVKENNSLASGTRTSLETAVELATAEGLLAHAQAARVRLLN